MDEILTAITRMDPERAMAELAEALKIFFSTLGEEARTHFLLNLVGKSEGDKVSSLVHL